MTFFLFLILCFIAIVLWPIIKAIFYVRNLKKRFTAGNKYRQADNSRQQQPRRSTQRKKKIDSDVGEYVPFEEVSTSSYSETVADCAGYSKITTEEQTVDVEWEEIKT